MKILIDMNVSVLAALGLACSLLPCAAFETGATFETVEDHNPLDRINDSAHGLRLLFAHADHIVLATCVEEYGEVYYHHSADPDQDLWNRKVPGIIDLMRPRWLIASRDGDADAFAGRLWRDVERQPYILLAHPNSYRHLDAPMSEVFRAAPHILFMVNAPEPEEPDIHQFGGLVGDAHEIYEAGPKHLFAPLVTSWGITFLGEEDHVLRHPSVRERLERRRTTLPDDPKPDQAEFNYRVRDSMFPRGSLFGESSGQDIVEAFRIFSEHVARERSLHGLDALVRAHPDNTALYFICYDLDGQNLLDYPVLTHLPKPPEDPKLILEKALAELEKVLDEEPVTPENLNWPEPEAPATEDSETAE